MNPTSPSPRLLPPCNPPSVRVGPLDIPHELILQLLKTSGVIKRSPRKIDPIDLISVLCSLCSQISPRYNDLAASLAESGSCSPSRQAVAARFTPGRVAVMGTLLAFSLAQRGQMTSTENPPPPFRSFGRVLVQDSTLLQISTALFPTYSGVGNGSETRVCNARIQAAFDLRAGQMLHYSIDPYSKNDPLAAHELPLQKGDLALRDRGYLSAEEIRRMLAAGADFILRHKTGVMSLDPETRQPINLADWLRSKGPLERGVLLNDAQGARVRLVAARVDERTAEQCRRKLRREVKGHNPSRQLLELQDWTLFITSLSEVAFPFEDLLALYGLRGRIEIIFKAWKSHLNFHVLHNVSETQLKILLKARFLMIAASTVLLHGQAPLKVWLEYRRRVSLLKFVRQVVARPAVFMRALDAQSGTGEERESFEAFLAKYCCYDKRKRQNYCDPFEALGLA